MQCLHLFANAGNGVRIVLPGGFLARGDAETGLQAVEIAGGVPVTAHHAGSHAAAHHARSAPDWWLRDGGNGGGSRDDGSEQQSASEFACHVDASLADRENRSPICRGIALTCIKAGTVPAHCSLAPFPASLDSSQPPGAGESGACSRA